jgi:hypothetical protein
MDITAELRLHLSFQTLRWLRKRVGFLDWGIVLAEHFGMSQLIRLIHNNRNNNTNVWTGRKVRSWGVWETSEQTRQVGYRAALFEPLCLVSAIEVSNRGSGPSSSTPIVPMTSTAVNHLAKYGHRRGSRMQKEYSYHE